MNAWTGCYIIVMAPRTAKKRRSSALPCGFWSIWGKSPALVPARTSANYGPVDINIPSTCIRRPRTEPPNQGDVSSSGRRKWVLHCRFLLYLRITLGRLESSSSADTNSSRFQLMGLYTMLHNTTLYPTSLTLLAQAPPRSPGTLDLSFMDIIMGSKATRQGP